LIPKTQDAGLEGTALHLILTAGFEDHAEGVSAEEHPAGCRQLRWAEAVFRDPLFLNHDVRLEPTRKWLPGLSNGCKNTLRIHASLSTRIA
jgi:hypothetical protein